MDFKKVEQLIEKEINSAIACDNDPLHLSSAHGMCQALIILDGGSGILTHSEIERLIQLQRRTLNLMLVGLLNDLSNIGDNDNE